VVRRPLGVREGKLKINEVPILKYKKTDVIFILHEKYIKI
jgi:hypothetical protein